MSELQAIVAFVDDETSDAEMVDYISALDYSVQTDAYPDPAVLG